MDKISQEVKPLDVMELSKDEGSDSGEEEVAHLSKSSKKIEKGEGKSERVTRARHKKGNSYINKIKTLMTKVHTETTPTDMNMNEVQRKRYDAEEEKSSTHEDALGGVIPVQKLERNRESARNSRKRKKVYIELLEKKVAALNEENATLKKQAEETAALAKSVHQFKLVNNLVSERNNLFLKMEKLLSKGPACDPSDIDLLLDSLRLRFGASGQERVTAINSMFKQIVDLILPLHMKYILYISSEGKHIFDQLGANSDPMMHNFFSPEPNDINRSKGSMGGWRNDEPWARIVEDLGLTGEQQARMAKFRRMLAMQKQRLEALINNLGAIRFEMLKETTSLQNYVDEMRKIMTPVQAAKTLLLLERERNSKELSAEGLWNPTKSSNLSSNDMCPDSANEQLKLLQGNSMNQPSRVDPMAGFSSFMEFKEYEPNMSTSDMIREPLFDYIRRLQNQQFSQ